MNHKWQVNRQSALQSLQAEQSEQIRERGKSMIHSEHGASRSASLKKELLTTENVEKMEERERKVNRRTATAQCNEVQREIVEELQAQDQNAQNVYKYGYSFSIRGRRTRMRRTYNTARF